MTNTSVNKGNGSREQLAVALIGLGGFGENYLRGLIDEYDGSAKLIAGVEPEPQRCRRIEQLKNLGIPIYSEIERIFDLHVPDLVVVASPAHLHGSHSCAALAQGIHVLCEKPAATTLLDALAMRDAQTEAHRLLAIGYQWSFSPTIQALKGDIMKGLLGRPRRLKSLVLWPRTESYYRRNSWAGKIVGVGGERICDNPVSNGCAHYLHNMLYVLGGTTSQSIWPESVECEIYRGNNIASFDTAVLRVRTSIEAEVLLVVSHAETTQREPTFHLEFEDATVDYDLAGEGRVVARWNNGMIRDYGLLPLGTDIRKLWITLQAIGSGGEIPCGIVAAVPHVAIVSATQQCVINALPPSEVQAHSQRGPREDGLHGLGADLTRCYEQWAMPSELGLSWSRPKQRIAIAPAKVVVTTTAQIVRKEHLV
jgi:predicted dehydrogenase